MANTIHMANICPICMANTDVVGRVHRCVPRASAKSPFEEMTGSGGKAACGDNPARGTYKYRNVDQRRAYMRDYMKRKRNAI